MLREELACPVDTLGLQPDERGGEASHYHADLNHPDALPADLPRYDLVVFAEVLEHLHTAPAPVLAALARRLTDEGTLLLQTPNAASLPKRLKLLFGRNPFEPLRGNPLDPGHFREYTLGELRALAAEAGLRVESQHRRFYFDARFGRHRDGAVQARPVTGRMKNLIYRALPPSLREGITLVLRRSRQALAMLATGTLFAALATAAVATRTIPYADLHGVFERLERLQGGRYLKASAALTSADPGVPTAAIELLIQSREGELPVPVAEDGTVVFPVRADLLAENPPVRTNVPQGKLQINVRLRVEAEPVDSLRYGLREAMLSEARTMINRQGLLARMLAPDFEDLVVSFGAGEKAWLTIEAEDGPERLDADAEGDVVIPDRRDWRRENPLIRASRLPLRIALRPR
jgi:hypothetical protein